MNKKLNLNVPFLLGIFLIGIFSPNVSQAQTNAYWDVNGTNAGQGGSATFSASGVYWTTSSTNATADTGGPADGALFNLTNGAAAGQSGNYILNFGGTAGNVKQGGSYEAVGINFLTTGYGWFLDGAGTNARTITTSNGVNINGNVLTISNGTTGTNSFTFAAAPGPAVLTSNMTSTNFVITGTGGGGLTLKNYAPTASSSFGVYVQGSTTKYTNIVGSVTNIFTNIVVGAISSNAPITVDIGAGSKIFLGSQSSGGATINSAITLNTNASGVALNITNSSSGTVALNGVISGANGLVLDNSSSGKILLSASNTYSGGTTLNNSGSGLITISNAAAFGTGTITSAGAITNYVRAEASAFNIANNWQIDSGSTLRLNANNSGWNVTASGVIAGAGSMMFSNSGVNYYLTGTNNSFGGGVSVGNGTLYFNKFGSAGENSSLGTNGTITVNGGTNTGGLRWNGTTNETSDKTIVLAGTNGNLNLYAEGAANSTLTINGNINSTGAGAKTLNFAGYSNNTLTLNGLINENGGVNSVIIGTSQSGTVVLGNANNSFSGAIRITNSKNSTLTVLSVAKIGNSGANSSLGKNGTINIGGNSVSAVTALRYTGAGETSDKVINLSAAAGGATLDQSGTGNLKFTSPITATGVGAKTITLEGSTDGTGELGAAISDLDGSVISLTKSGSGAWRLSGVNTYTGLTTIGSEQKGWAGILKIDLTNGLVNGVMVGASGATNMGMLDLTAGGNYVMNSYGNSDNSGQNMSFTNSSVIASTLTFTNANNYITIASQGGKTLTNAAANLTIVFNGAVDIGSSTNNDVTFAGAGNFRVNGALTSTGAGVRGLKKSDNGTLILNAASAYDGATTVNGGTLQVGSAGALPATSAITVSNGATLRFLKSSSGINVGAMTVAGTLEQNLVTITSSGAVDLTGSILTVNGTPSESSYILVTGTSLTGKPDLSPLISDYALRVSGKNLLLEKVVTDAYALYLSNNNLPAGTAFNAIIDGVTVGLKYAFESPNGIPQNNGVAAVPVIDQLPNGDQQMTYTFDVNEDSALTVTYQTSTDLVTWEPTLGKAVTAGSGSSPTGFLKKQVQATGSEKLFIRINVTR